MTKSMFTNSPFPVDGYTQITAFSQGGGWHTNAFSLELTAGPDAVAVWYTLDGSEPHPDRVVPEPYAYKNQYPLHPDDPFGPLLERTRTTWLYEAPLWIDDMTSSSNVLSVINTTISQHPLEPDGLVVKGVVVRARAENALGELSPIVTQTYFVRPATHWPTLPTLSLVTDEAHFFGYETGFYVPGKIFDDWRIANPSSMRPVQLMPANYHERGDVWERPVHAEFFDEDGARVFAQNLGARTHGTSSRMYPRKSLRLYARTAYDNANQMDYPFFGERLAHGGSGTVSSFRRLIIRNSGGDYAQTLYRDALLQELAAPLPLARQATRPVVHYLNGEYWGIMNLRERQDEHYLASHYGVAADDIAMLSRHAQLEAGFEADRDDYLALYQFALLNDLSDPAAYAWVAERMDVRNYALYFALQIYIANTDWPQNNIAYWRKRVAPPVEGAPSGHDGRWRWLLYDLDFGFDPDRIAHNSLTRVATYTTGSAPSDSTRLFRRLLEQPDFRIHFLNALTDLPNGPFRPDRVANTVDAFNARIETERDAHIHRWHSGTNRGEFLKAFADARPEIVLAQAEDFFGLEGTAQLTVLNAVPTAGGVRVNNLDITIGSSVTLDPDEPFPWSGAYFKGVPISLTASPNVGFAFVGWRVAGADADDFFSNSLAVEWTMQGDSTIEAVFTPDPVPYDFTSGDYVFASWSPDEPDGVYPPHMLFLQSDQSDTEIDTPLLYRYSLGVDDYHADDTATIGFPYNNTRRTRINGLDDAGVAFINTGQGRDLGGALLALDTRGATNITVEWTAGTVTPNDRVYALRLQYRVGAFGPFADVLDGEGDPVVYERSPIAGHAQVMPVVALPEEVLGQPYVQLLWRYHRVAGTSGPRAQLRLDDIQVSAGAVFGVHAAASPAWGGSVSGEGPYAPGASVVLSADAAPHFDFAHWAGEVPEGGATNNPLTFAAHEHRSVTAHFAPRITDNTGTPHWWLARHRLTNTSFEAAAVADHSGNDLPAWMEYVADLDPLDPAARLPALALTRNGAAWQFWLSETSTGRLYYLQSAPHLLDGGWVDLIHAPGAPGWTQSWPDHEAAFRPFRVRIGVPPP